MRLNITFSCRRGNNFLPVNYQYAISSWIYKRIAEANQKLATSLHLQGYGEGNRKFKLFNFGPLDLRPYHFHRDRGVFELLGDQAKLSIGFYLPDMAEPFIKGVFLNNEVYIGDRINGVSLKVDQVEVADRPGFSETMTYRLLSPCCVTRPPGEEEAYAKYLWPDHAEFVPRLIRNLESRYEVASNIFSMAGVDDFDQEGGNIDFKVLGSKFKSKLIKIKALTRSETKVRGWLFDCELTAPVEVQEFVWDVGLGEKGSMGFGMVEA
ncbi:CRISPR-associated endoribonuclease Cas6 [Fulvivirga sp. 29W222]|uniref:CRISPR-associated endoribonuclease n=1 Tax=Fulvivirga marina TaxID=2494733 RepID=A0A937FYD8_9BACT|nr:CRISPR-associated endoribonuclease Cas6 [Fulvivirga marina]MBL6447072.1 CRISPR-associated endoribonuclease Cas6 [Fulvivirga marina]